MGILDQYLSQLPPGTFETQINGPTGAEDVFATPQGGNSYSMTDANTGASLGSRDMQYQNDWFTSAMPYVIGGLATMGIGSMVMGAGAVGADAGATVGGADAGGSTMAGADTLSLGDGMTAADFSYGADSSGSLLSSLGTALGIDGTGGITGFSKLLPLLGQVIGGVQARKSGNTANDLANRLIAASDPFGPYRAQYAQKLQALEASKDVTSIPGYQAGLQAVERAGASQGFTGSGNMMKALQDYGGNFYNAELQRLATLAGAGTTPGNGFAQGANLIGQGQASGAFGTQQLLNGLAGILGPGNSMSALGSGGTTAAAVGNPATVSTDLMAG